MVGSQDFEEDPANEAVLIGLNGALVPRAEARVSVFDAGFVLGDGIWEGLRLHRGVLLFLDEHLDRLYAGAAAISLDIGMTRAALTGEIWRVLRANCFKHGVHLRLMVTRGIKSGANQDPRNALGTPTIVILAETQIAECGTRPPPALRWPRRRSAARRPACSTCGSTRIAGSTSSRRCCRRSRPVRTRR